MAGFSKKDPPKGGSGVSSISSIWPCSPRVSGLRYVPMKITPRDMEYIDSKPYGGEEDDKLVSTCYSGGRSSSSTRINPGIIEFMKDKARFHSGTSDVYPLLKKRGFWKRLFFKDKKCRDMR